MINLVEYGREVFIDKDDYDENDRIYLDNLKINMKNENIFDIREVQNGMFIKAFNYVGTIQLSKKRINIFPRFDKSFSKLIYLILYTKDIKFKNFKQNLKTTKGEDDLIEIVIQLFIEEVENILKRDFTKDYTRKTDNLEVIKGRINFTQDLKKNYLRGNKIYCEFDELNYNTIENQVILKALIIAKHKVNNTATKRRIQKYIKILETYCTVYEKSRFPKIAYNRLNVHYKEIHYFCEIIMNNIGIKNIYKSGEFLGKYSILIDMNELFEKFVAKLCKVYLSETYDVLTQYKKRDAIVTSMGKTYKYIIPDIVLRKKTTGDFTIIDTKNKDYDNNRLSNSDIYQLSFYGMYFSDMFEKPVKISVVYPKYETVSFVEDKIFIQSMGKKRQGVSIHIKGVDINEALDYIEKESI